MRSQTNKTILRITVTALMAALVFWASGMRIVMPISIGGNTAFHLGNIMCALSGLVLGPVWGGLGAGLGSMLYDWTNPLYIVESPITFVLKGAYGLVAGLVAHKLFKAKKDSYVIQLVSSAAAAVSYMILYSAKVFFYNGIILSGFGAGQAWALVITKGPATLFNGAVAIVFAPILGVAINKALKAAKLDILPTNK